MRTPTNREEFHDMLVEILGGDNVYCDPPEGFAIRYPALVYHMDKTKNISADDKPYIHTFNYTVTLIDEYPDSDVFHKLLELPRCSHDRHFTSDGMNHDVFTINY